MARDRPEAYPAPEAYPDWPNLAAMMFDRARTDPGRAMLRVWREGSWRAMTWGEFARQAASLARGLRAAGVAAGDRVVIVSENRPEYPVAEVALMAIRAVPVPTYVTNTVADHAHVLRDSGARAAIVSSGALAATVAAAGALDLLVVMDDPPPGTRRFADLAADPAPPDDIAAEAATIPAGTLACIIYTSGTGGTPKGVMLAHRAILSNCRGAHRLLAPLRLRDEVYLSFLPLSHSYEHTAGQFYLLSIGTEVAYARGIEHLASDLAAIRPTIIAVVPRILEVIRARVLGQVARERRWRQALFRATLAIGLRRLDGARLSWPERLADPLLDRLVRARVRQRFGGRLVAAMSGGARLEPEVGRFFLALGVLVLQGYGQTEAGPVVSANPPDAVRIDTVGRVLDGVDLRIAEDGEILLRGDLVMQGYWGLPEATAEAIRDGWLHTGDIGELDAAGYLRITDRKKDMIVLSGGENVSPARIEGRLMGQPEIAQAVVAGEGRGALAALLVPADGVGEPALAAAVARVNAALAVGERVRRHASVPAFTIEAGLLTPTHKIRRPAVIAAYRDVLAALGG